MGGNPSFIVLKKKPKKKKKKEEVKNWGIERKKVPERKELSEVWKAESWHGHPMPYGMGVPPLLGT